MAPDHLKPVDDRLREVTRFELHNLLHEPPPGGPFDVIFCHNALVYFAPEPSRTVVLNLVSALAPEGLLCFGPMDLALAVPPPGLVSASKPEDQIWRRPEPSAPRDAKPSRRQASPAAPPPAPRGVPPPEPVALHLHALRHIERFDAGGAGFGLAMLADAGGRPVGIDYDAATLSDIQRRRSQSATLVRADATRLPLQSASFDVAVSFETIEHVTDAHALVAELRRIVKPGGRLVVSTPNRAFGPPERHTVNPFHIREFTSDELRALLREFFETVRLYGQRPPKAYRYVPFLMIGPHSEPAALAWKALVRLPFGIRNLIAMAVSGRPFYPGETDYYFDCESTDGAHALLAVAQ